MVGVGGSNVCLDEKQLSDSECDTCDMSCIQKHSHITSFDKIFILTASLPKNVSCWFHFLQTVVHK